MIPMSRFMSASFRARAAVHVLRDDDAEDQAKPMTPDKVEHAHVYRPTPADDDAATTNRKPVC
jgi:hypothetical protein